MKKTNLALPIIALIAGIISTSYGQVPATKYSYNGENLQEASNGTVDITKHATYIPKISKSDYNKFKNESEIRIHNNEKVFADFKVNLAKINQEDKASFQKVEGQFEQENINMKNKLVSMKNDKGQAKWKSFKRGFNHDMDALGIQMWGVE